MTTNKESSQPSLLSIAQMSDEAIQAILARGDRYLTEGFERFKSHKPLRGKVVINMFFESSTRTRVSFELAAKRLGAEVINIVPKQSSIKKGETLDDTFHTLAAMEADIIVIRHPEPEVPLKMAEYLRSYEKCSIINAGDGTHAHPTQALADALTVKRNIGGIRGGDTQGGDTKGGDIQGGDTQGGDTQGSGIQGGDTQGSGIQGGDGGDIQGLNIAICGDIAHSRVARSNVALLERLGAKVHLIGPKFLIPKDLSRLRVFNSIEEGLKHCQIIMMLRLQQERLTRSEHITLEDYKKLFCLTEEKLKGKEVLVMHPGPINRNVEITESVADDITRSLVYKQVRAGVAVRMACLEYLVNGL